MVQGCGAQCSKFFLIAFNVLFFIAGCGVLGIGIWVLTDGGGFLSLTRLDKLPDIKSLDNKTSFQQIGTIMIVAGAIVFVIAFLGCCGAIKGWRPLLVMYALFLIIILGLEVGAGIYSAVESNKVEGLLKKSLNESLHEFYSYTERDSAFNQAWYHMMNYFGCCGADSYKDFYNDTMIPKECCNKTQASHLKACEAIPSADKKYLYQEGCGDALINFLKSKLTIIIGVGIGIGLVQIFGIVFAFCLCSAIGSEI